MQYTITNEFLKVAMNGHTETNIFTKLLLQISAREIHNSMVILPEEGGLKEARDNKLSSVIQGYATYFRPNSKMCHPVTRLCTGVRVA